jgi:hypothetical protein
LVDWWHKICTTGIRTLSLHGYKKIHVMIVY